MKKENKRKILKVLGVIIMLVAYPIIPDEYPWYYQTILFNIGLFLFLSTKWNKLKKELGINKN
ncbi:MAG: hypothetical protein GW839_06885 [Flavobacteriales bacterium]|nr:hypothetical protein [Flavobacteriales bacterium]PIV95174.1 MAG: hypothetical protein COW44_00380 [Flavobacteriaceae bacterium CG17_big_fil_post_rev_8_21_14_2_50_33_15]